MRTTPNASVEYHRDLYRDLDADTAAAARAARAELPCSECGSNFGMLSGWAREFVIRDRPEYKLYACSWNDHELYVPCIMCNPSETIPSDFTLLTPEQVAAWLARECQCPDCRRERYERR